MKVSRVLRRQQRRLVTGILLASPILAAPYFPGCGHSHGAYPTTCTPGVGSTSCPTDGWEQLRQVETTLAEAQTTSVVNIGGLGDWSALEICFGDQSHSGTLVYSGASPLDPSKTIYCFRNLALLQIWLRKFVAHQDASNSACTGGRVGFINLAPIFSQLNKLPEYLVDRHFNDPEVIAHFEQLWFAVLVELADPAYMLATDDRASWFISIGNEIDMYLNDREQPYPVVGGSAPYPGPVARWSEYSAFYSAVAGYVQSSAAEAGVPVSVGTTVRWGEQPGDGVCGPKVLADHYSASTDCIFSTARNGAPASATVYPDEGIQIALTHLAMAAASNLFVYTRYYPHFLGEQPGTDLQTLRTQFQIELSNDFSAMGTWSTTATYLGQTPNDLPIVLQEISYPSAWNDGIHLAVDNVAANAIVDQQASFVTDSFQAWYTYNQNTTGAPILSYNWFNLNDFPTAWCDAATGGNYFPFCTWGLWTSAHQYKADPQFTGWYNFSSLGQGLNSSDADPPRACP